MEKRKRFFILWICMMGAMAVGCGGSRQSVTPQPDPFPTATEEATTEERDTSAAEDTKPAEPVVKDTTPVEQTLELKTVYFEYDKTDLTSKARRDLAENARRLKANPEINVRIEGHCDERGTVDYNLALGERRARATRAYLINFGINPARINIVSYGKEKPLDQSHGPDAWSKNRRAEFVRLN